jgi:hypothetical protein
MFALISIRQTNLCTCYKFALFLTPQKSPRSLIHKQQQGVMRVAAVQEAGEVSKCHYSYTYLYLTHNRTTLINYQPFSTRRLTKSHFPNLRK